MKNSFFSVQVTAAALCLSLTSVSFGAFAPDEFNDPTLGSQWTWNPGISASTTTSTYSMTGTAMRLTPAPGADVSSLVDKYAYLEQDAPAGTNWEIITKIDDFNSSQTGYQLPWQSAGMMLFQDTEHWVMVSICSNSSANNRGIQGTAQFDPTTSVSAALAYYQSAAQMDITTPSLYLRIRKDTKGYIGSASADGTNWVDVTTLLKNPHTMDGMLTNEKIRLFGSGGNLINPTTQVACPANFDFLHYATITPAVAGYKDDEFNGTSLDPVWHYGQGVYAGSYTISGGTLNLVVPRWQELWYNDERQQALTQDAPAEPNYAITMKATPTSYLAYQFWTAHGIRLMQDQNHWFLIDFTKSSLSSGVNSLQVGFQDVDGTVNDTINPTPFGATGEGPGYLRIEKAGNFVRGLYSMDGVTWTAVTSTGRPNGWFTFVSALRNPQIQIVTKRPNAAVGPDPVVQVDYIRKSAFSTSASDWQLYR